MAYGRNLKPVLPLICANERGSAESSKLMAVGKNGFLMGLTASHAVELYDYES